MGLVDAAGTAAGVGIDAGGGGSGGATGASPTSATTVLAPTTGGSLSASGCDSHGPVVREGSKAARIEETIRRLPNA